MCKSIEFKGKKYRSLLQLHKGQAAEGVSLDCFYQRVIKMDWDLEKALNEPIITARSVEFNGCTYSSLKALYSEKKPEGVSYGCFWNRVYTMGWGIEKALNEPTKRNK